MSWLVSLVRHYLTCTYFALSETQQNVTPSQIRMCLAGMEIYAFLSTLKNTKTQI